MMRLFFTVLLLSIAFSFEAWAQSDDGSGRRVYNSERYGSQLYNSPNLHGTRGPLSLRQMLEGKSNAATGSRNSYYGGRDFRPYGMDSGSRSLSLSPDAVRASRARRDALAVRMEKDNLRQLQQSARTDGLQSQTEGFLNKFRPQTGTGSNAYLGQNRPIYKKRKKGFEMPAKVFNSIR